MSAIGRRLLHGYPNSTLLSSGRTAHNYHAKTLALTSRETANNNQFLFSIYKSAGDTINTATITMKTIQNQIAFAANVQEVTIVLDVKSNNLLEVEYIKSIVKLDESVHHIFKHNGKEIDILQGSEDFKMFKDRDAFEHGSGVAMACINLEGSFIPHHCYRTNAEDKEKIDMVSVTFVNGVPVEVDAPVVGFECHAARGHVRIEPIYDTKVNIEEYYRSVEHATAFHDYDYYDKEGNKQTAKGRFSFILPDDEQKVVVEELRAVLEKADKAGLRLVFDNNCCRTHVVNTRTCRIAYDEDPDGARYFTFSEDDLPDSIKLPQVISDYNSDDYGCKLIEKGE